MHVNQHLVGVLENILCWLVNLRMWVRQSDNFPLTMRLPAKISQLIHSTCSCEQVRRGEVNYTPEEIYSMVVDPRRIGAKRARKSKVATLFSLYEKNEAQMAALQEQLDSEKKKVAKQDKEISKLQSRERNLREYLNEVFKTNVDDGFTWDDVLEDENDYAGDNDDL
ncbi:hypothetical protein MKX03_025942 [Papaver bracteatum]|nr:hypothetical protein MKX03_025942 [Papaver bracteatum]